MLLWLRTQANLPDQADILGLLLHLVGSPTLWSVSNWSPVMDPLSLPVLHLTPIYS